METDRPARRSRQPLGPRMRARQDNARAEAIDRVARWKRGIGAGAVVAFGALIGVVGVAGAKGASSPAGSPASGPPVTSPSDRDDGGSGGVAGGGPSGGGSDGRAAPDDQVSPGVAPGQAPRDGYFGGQSGSYGFGDVQGSPSDPHGQSNAS
jgi:hypothetical protein